MTPRLLKIKRNIGKIPLAAPMYHTIKKIWLYSFFISDFITFNKLSSGKKRFSVSLFDQFPCLLDNTGTTSFDPHYTYHPAWAARVIAHTKPKLHIDFSSFLQFSTLVSAFVPVHFYDYRPAEIKLDNLETKKGDLTSMPFIDNSVESLSCMHVVEHVGLGRYGDPLDADGDLKAIQELKRVLAPKGNLMFVVPIGKPKIQFNAHRIYSYAQIMEYFSDLKLVEFSLILDGVPEAGLIKNASKELSDAQAWGCGCFWFTKD
ncbi:MAG: DUF268 domain-containing protein [Minisyncoccia bacterium]